jgi:hypothetical protein
MQCQNSTCTNILTGKYQTKYCSTSCAAKVNNSNRSTESREQQRITIFETLGKEYKPLVKKEKKYTKATGPYCKLSDKPKEKKIPVVKIHKDKKYTKATGPYTKLHGYTTCNYCRKGFWRLSFNQACCSISCRDNIRSQNKCRKTQIEYFNIYENKNVILQSTWEVTIADWLATNNVVWIRPSKRLKWYDTTLDVERTYLPDFYLKDFNVYLDVKNPLKQKEDADKISQLIELFPLYVGDIGVIQSMVSNLIS